MTRPSVLLFDLGGVLVQNGSFDGLRAMLGCQADDDELRDRWLRSPAVRNFELGRISPNAFARLFLEEWQIPLPVDAFLAEFVSWIKDPYPGAGDLLAGLRRDHHVSCLSNCNELHWTALAPILGWFDSTFSSHLIGEIKPDERAFQTVLDRLGVQPDRVVYVDDARTNVEAAGRAGIPSFAVQGFDELRARLSEEGVL
ncbi:MAG: HAD-IA family hydrolase [Thermoleophilia bacterium]|nr:HAD-IA family hydrolase [Thermoleophilia bacterium]